MTEAEILQEIKLEAREVGGRVELDCEKALALAARSAAAPAVVGRLCNEHGIRIVACQLGCFP